MTRTNTIIGLVLATLVLPPQRSPQESREWSCLAHHGRVGVANGMNEPLTVCLQKAREGHGALRKGGNGHRASFPSSCTR
jgi:hypothetical protein